MEHVVADLPGVIAEHKRLEDRRELLLLVNLVTPSDIASAVSNRLPYPPVLQPVTALHLQHPPARFKGSVTKRHASKRAGCGG